jgi:hypothetical protein
MIGVKAKARTCGTKLGNDERINITKRDVDDDSCH